MFGDLQEKNPNIGRKLPYKMLIFDGTNIMTRKFKH